MRLAEFIENNLERVLAQWQAFAETRLPSAARMDALALRDHAPQILLAVAADLRMPQTAAEQSAKSQGLAPDIPSAPHTAAEAHGALRARSGFSMTQLVSEYRALRTSVLGLWASSGGIRSDATAPEDVMRFNEAIDQAVAESVDFFAQELELARRQREEGDRALALNRARLEYATRLSGVGFWYCNLPFDRLEWDAQVKEHFFFGPDVRVTIDAFYERIHDDDREATRRTIEATIRDRTPYDIVYRTRHPATGEVKWIRALGGTGYAADGAPIHFDGISVDVSAQRLQEQRVAESEARHRGVLANMDEAFVLFDADFNIIEVNDAVCRLVRLERGELIGSNHWERVPGTYESELGRMYRAVLQDGELRCIEHHHTFEDGRQRWLEVRAFMVNKGVAVLFHDVTERREIINALKLADKRKDEFLAMLAHELRNPLAPITSAGELLARITNPQPPVATATAIIQRQTKHLTRLVEDLLDVSRITQGRVQLQKGAVDVSAVVVQAVETCQSQFQAKDQHLTVSTSTTGSLHVEGDFARLVQCVGNLLSNASKYTNPRGDIQVRVGAEGGNVVIEVVDTGSGIGPDLLPYVFDLFVQSHRTLDRSQGGLGVGLAVVKRLVEMHGGEVRAFSAGEGRGSTFTVRIPRHSATATAEQGPDAPRLAPRRILVVDDNVDAAQSLAMLMELQGHTCIEAYGAADALSSLEGFKPDLMLIDIGLPEVDGYALAQQLRLEDPQRRMCLVALTGYGQPEDRQRALDAGFDDHLVKPVDLGDLERAIAASPVRTS